MNACAKPVTVLTLPSLLQRVSAGISLIGAGLLLSGKVPEDTVTAALGMAASVRCIKLCLRYKLIVIDYLRFLIYFRNTVAIVKGKS